MPELPEVQAFRTYFDESSLHQRIGQVRVHDDKIIRNVSGEAFIEKLTGRTFINSYRRGKYLFGALNDGNHVLLHFGMTGDLKYYGEGELPPKYERFVLDFDNGMHLGFDDPRKFAKIRYLEDLDAYIESVGLGPDALLITETEFLQKMEGKKGSLKGWLLNQGNLAGVGNLYADEICYQTKVHPASPVHKIPARKRKELYRATHKIMNEAAERLPHYREYPTEWYWTVWREEGKKNPKGKGTIVSAKIAGRTTYWAEGDQKLYG